MRQPQGILPEPIPSWQSAEILTGKIVESEGWEVIYSETWGPFDVVCRRDGKVRLIQVKLRHHVHSQVLAGRIAKEVLDSYVGKEKLYKDVTMEVWIYYWRNGSWHIFRECYNES